MSELTPAVNDTNFESEVTQSPLPVLVDFWAEWCGPCRALGPILEELAPQYQDKLKIMKLNVDESGALAAKFNVMNIPTMVIFKQGKEFERLVGLSSKEELEKQIQKAIA